MTLNKILKYLFFIKWKTKNFIYSNKNTQKWFNFTVNYLFTHLSIYLLNYLFLIQTLTFNFRRLRISDESCCFNCSWITIFFVLKLVFVTFCPFGNCLDFLLVFNFTFAFSDFKFFMCLLFFPIFYIFSLSPSLPLSILHKISENSKKSQY